MPFHKIGEKAKAMEPTGAKFDLIMGTPAKKVNSAEAVSDEVINSWFQDAFLALRDDPYIHMKMDSREHRGNLFIFRGDRMVEFPGRFNTIEQMNKENKRNGKQKETI